MNRASFLRLAAAAPLWWRHAIAGGHSPDARSAGIAWLLSRQSEDGAWRSQTYGAFRDGRALTPMVLRALAGCPDAEAACRTACAWLGAQGEALFEEYPVHHASAILETLAKCPALENLARLARERLASLQCPRTGGWSYSLVRPSATGELAPMQQANLAATVMAVDGLRAGGLRADDAALARALRFIHTCQNHGTGEAGFDDGGFFQMPGDPARNKAGSAGKDSRATERYLSYASGTADGLRAMLLCGEAIDSPRVAAAIKWLKDFRWKKEGAPNSPADLIYYTTRSIRRTADACPALSATANAIRPLLAEAQSGDGSWTNAAGEMRENCPVVATALAVEALD